MKTFRRLVVAVDESAASARSVVFAAALAKQERCAIELCSALDESAVMLPIAEGALINPLPMIEALEAAASRHIAAAAASLADAGILARGSILRGSPAAEIEAFARREQADAILMGTSGRSGVERMFMGSVTTALLCIADIPVITVHADDTLEPGPLLVALDASAASLAALDCALGRARATGATLHLIHVFEESRIDRLSAAMGLRPASASRQALADAEDALAEAAAIVRAAGVAFTSEIVRGVAVESILAAAAQRSAGGIAIGTHGRGALERFLIGSVAGGVIRNARVPVYIVHRRVNSARARTVRYESATHQAMPI